MIDDKSTEKSKVFFTSFRCRPDEGPTDKLKRLIKAAGIGQIDMDGKFVAVKMHFGELGNLAYLRPNYARAVVDVIKQLGGKPFLTDCNTLYPGSRKNAIEHLYCAWENGFTPLTVANEAALLFKAGFAEVQVCWAKSNTAVLLATR